MLNRRTGKITEKNLIAKRMSLISPSGIRKFFDLLASMDDVISLGVGEPDYSTPWHVTEAAIRSLEKGYTMYTSNMGMPELRDELARYLAEHSAVKYDPGHELLITVGVSEALDLSLRAIIDPGDEVIIADPSYVAYEACVTLAGGQPVRVPTYEKNNFELLASDVEAKISPKTKAILIGFPANPTGAVMSREKLEAIGKLAERLNLVVISDEIYSRLIYGDPHTCFASLSGMRERTIFIGGFSKAYAMTGWRVGFAAAPKQVIAAMTKVHQYTMMSAPTMSQVAAIEALRSGEDAVQEMVEDYDRRRKYIVSGLNEIGLPCFEPKGAFYAFPSIKSTGLSSEDFSEKLLTEEKVAVVPGSAFGTCGEGYVRCCYATSIKDIEEALRRMKRFVTNHN
ncbi:aminotransferase class I/II-fold pyridoxal phosphate-dependent enzyme [Chloroflexota bacterium]